MEVNSLGTYCFRELATFIKYGNDKNAMKELVENDERFKHLDPLVANIVNDVTKAGLKIVVNEKGEVDMCVAIAGIIEDARVEGRVEGETKKAIETAKNLDAMGMDIPFIAKALSVGTDVVKKWIGVCQQ